MWSKFISYSNIGTWVIAEVQYNCPAKGQCEYDRSQSLGTLNLSNRQPDADRDLLGTTGFYFHLPQGDTQVPHMWSIGIAHM